MKWLHHCRGAIHDPLRLRQGFGAALLGELWGAAGFKETWTRRKLKPEMRHGREAEIQPGVQARSREAG